MIDMRYFTKMSIVFTLVFLGVLGADNNRSKEETKKCIDKDDSKILIGAIENIKIEPPRVTLQARIDTGAKTTSIDAREITPFERDGKRWVRFLVLEGSQEHKVERPVYDTVLIKRHGGKSQRRYMIKMRVSAGGVSQLIPVTLTDRSHYEYPILIGRNFLRDYFIVDVSQKHLLKKEHSDE